MFVLGIDPGLSRCGYGCVVRESARESAHESVSGDARRGGRRPRAVAAGVIRTDPAHERAHRLAELQGEIRALIAEFEPDVVAIERVLFQHNVSTAMSVGMASGIVLAEAAAAGCGVVEYSPNEVKESVAGWGGADKDEVGRMVQTLLDLPVRLAPADAADAVAVALCHLARIPAARAARTASTTAAGTAGGRPR